MAQVWLDRRDCEYEDLPGFCLKCGNPTTRRVSKTFNWMPGWVYLMLLIHILVFLIVAAVTRKTMRAAVPMCDQHRHHWLFRTLGIIGSLFLLVGAIVGLAILASEFSGPRGNPDVGLVVFLGIVGAILVWIIAIVVVNVTAIRPTLIDDRGMRLTGVSEEFVEAYRDQVREHRPRLPDLDRGASERWGERRPRRREDDEDDRPYRRDEDDWRDREDRRRRRDEDY